MMNQIYLSIVIPAYRSAVVLEKNLPELFLWINQQDFHCEVIIVNDGSNDHGATMQLAERFGCVYQELNCNQGKGAAVRAGMKKAQGKYRFFTDSDIPFNCTALTLFLFYLETKEFDLVVGDRGLEESDYFSLISGRRRFGSGFFTFLVGRFVTTGFSDTQCGLKGFRAAVAEDLFGAGRINGFAFDVELIYIALKRNYDIKKLPVQLRSQDGGSVSVLKHGWRMVLDLFVIKWNHLKGNYKKK
jgi:dolichyl-phosphate beta-glucosyltransferase